MAADLERLAEQFASRYPEIASLLRDGAVIARKLGAPESFSTLAEQAVGIVKAPDLSAKVYPEIPLPEERQRQGLVLAGRFAARLGFDSHEAYMATLPEFPEKPSTYARLGLTVPVIVETRVPWLEAAGLSGLYVTDYMKQQMNAGGVKDWEGINFDMPEVPFAAWVQDGSKFMFRKPSEARKELGKKENKGYVAGSILLAISMYDVRPDMVRTMFWDVIGAAVGSDGVPCLGHWGVGPGLGARHVDRVVPSYRVLVFGREIRTLNLAV